MVPRIWAAHTIHSPVCMRPVKVVKELVIAHDLSVKGERGPNHPSPPGSEARKSQNEWLATPKVTKTSSSGADEKYSDALLISAVPNWGHGGILGQVAASLSFANEHLDRGVAIPHTSQDHT